MNGGSCFDMEKAIWIFLGLLTVLSFGISVAFIREKLKIMGEQRDSRKKLTEPLKDAGDKENFNYMLQRSYDYYVAYTFFNVAHLLSNTLSITYTFATLVMLGSFVENSAPMMLWQILVALFAVSLIFVNILLNALSKAQKFLESWRTLDKEIQECLSVLSCGDATVEKTAIKKVVDKYYEIEKTIKE